MKNFFPWQRFQGFRVLIVVVVLAGLLTSCLGDIFSDNPLNTPTAVMSEATQSAVIPGSVTTTPVLNGNPNSPAGPAATPGTGPNGAAGVTATAGAPAAGGNNGGQLATVTPVPGNNAPAGGSIPVTGQNQAVLDLQHEFTQLYKNANPGVVNIRLDVTQGSQSGVATGSGWIYDDQGHIVTNNHVVAEGSNLIVTFFDSFEETAKVVGTDPYSDLAVIQVQNMPKNVHALKMASKDATQVGDLVVAIGSPFGLGSTMTTGIISALGRDIPALVNNYSIPQAIQTDAAINPGNSGGPLIDLNGEVIGVNSQIATGGTNQSSGVGFAIPVNIVNLVVPALIQKGQYTWPYLGISGTTVDLAIQQANRLDIQQGAYIDQVVKGGPAAQAGLRGSSGTASVLNSQVPSGGDIVTAVDGKPTISYDQLLGQIALHKPGDTVTLTVLRGGKQSNVQVKLGARPAGDISPNPSGGLPGPQ